MSKHTPGPWEVFHSLNVNSSNGRLIANCGGYQSNYQDETQANVANAQLIAAAPELLEACKKFVAKVESGHTRAMESYKQMKAAIAKAEGQE